jgi:HlyD family secretion protein
VAILVAAGGAMAARRALVGRPVKVVHAERRELVQTVVSSGRVLAPAAVTLAALSSGTVTAVLATEGQKVEPGQLLAQVDDREQQAAVRQAEAAVARASAGAAQVRRLSLPVAKERLRQAELTLEQARRAFSRDDALARSGAITTVAIVQSRTALDVAESQKSAADLQVAAATGTGSDVLSAAAGLELARAQLAAARAARDRTRVTSPVAGIVLERHVDTGQSAQIGTPLFMVSSIGKTRLVIEPDERNLALLQLGQPALASAEAYPKQRFAAVVGFVAPSVDAQRGTIEVRLDVEAPPPYLKPDMTVSVEVEVARKAGALVLPSTAVRDLAAGHPWVLVASERRAVRREVGVGVIGEGLVEVTSGVTDTDAILVAAPPGLLPGARIDPEGGAG